MSTPNILRNNSVQNAQPPFSNSQVSETVVHREILNIYQRARPETKPYYDQGRDTQGLEEENWVIRWLLWHVFRYRDNRNKNRRQGSPDHRFPSSSENSSSEGPPHGTNGMFPVFELHPQAAEIVHRQQRTLEWSFQCELERESGILRPSSRYSAISLKLHFRGLRVEPFAGYTTYRCLAESCKSRNLQSPRGRRFLVTTHGWKGEFCVPAGPDGWRSLRHSPSGSASALRSRTFPSSNNILGVFNANSSSKANSYRSFTCGNHLSLKLGDGGRGRVKVCDSA